MKLGIKYMMAALVMIGMCGCDDNLELFEVTGSTAAPVAVENISSEALPGQILLRWEVPAGAEYHYVQVKYTDPLLKKDVYRVASLGTDSLLIDNTRARFGEYEFRFQSFNYKDEGGEVKTIKAVSGKAPATQTVTLKKIVLKENQLSSNYPEPTEGPIKNLLDGNPNTFFHTRWSSPQYDMPHYIQVDLNEPHENFCFYYQNRNGSQVGAQKLEVQISNDGEDWETIETISSRLPSGSKEEYTSEVFQPGKAFTHFRYNVVKTYGDAKYFNMAEFALYDAQIDIYDPETVTLE